MSSISPNVSPVPMTVCDASGNCIDANEAMGRLIGATREAVLLQNFHDLDSWKRSGLLEVALEALERHQPQHKELTLTTSFSQTITIDYHFIPWRIEASIYLLVIMSDLSDRKVLEARLRQSETMESLGQLTGGLAHDFNNQLSGMMGLADLLLGRIDDPEHRQMVQRIIDAAQRAADLTRKLLVTARGGRERSATLDLEQILDEVISVLKHTIDKRILIERTTDKAPHFIQADSTQVHSALLNLALNARDAMPEGGRLRFGTTRIHLEDAQPPGDFVQIEIEDSGRGMSAPILEKIFDPFFTTKPQGVGTGMGLAAVHGTIEQHQGTISVESHEGEGALFRLRFPAVEDQAPGRARPTTPRRPEAHLEILLAEDEPLVRQTIHQQLMGLGHEVVCCTNGQEAVALLRQDPKRFDLIFLDMIMPVMNGGDAFHALREIDPAVKIMLISGFAVDTETQALLDTGASAFIRKPFVMAEMRQGISVLLGPPKNQSKEK